MQCATAHGCSAAAVQLEERCTAIGCHADSRDVRRAALRLAAVEHRRLERRSERTSAAAATERSGFGCGTADAQGAVVSLRRFAAEASHRNLFALLSRIGRSVGPTSPAAVLVSTDCRAHRARARRRLVSPRSQPPAGQLRTATRVAAALRHCGLSAVQCFVRWHGAAGERAARASDRGTPHSSAGDPDANKRTNTRAHVSFRLKCVRCAGTPNPGSTAHPSQPQCTRRWINNPNARADGSTTPTRAATVRPGPQEVARSVQADQHGEHLPTLCRTLPPLSRPHFGVQRHRAPAAAASLCCAGGQAVGRSDHRAR